MFATTLLKMEVGCKKRVENMKLTKIFLAVAALFAIACTPDNGDNQSTSWVEEGSIVGEWCLTSWAGSSSAKPQIYIAFNDDGTFNLYQQAYSVIWFKYDGRYALNNNVLTGAYSDGKPLASEYKVAFSSDGKMIRLTSLTSSSDVAAYNATEVPAWIIEEAKTPQEVRSVEAERFL